MKSVLLPMIITLLATSGCISVPEYPFSEKLESQPIRSESRKDKEEFYFSGKEIVSEGNDNKIRLTVSKQYQIIKANIYKIKYGKERKIRHEFSKPMVPIFEWWMDGIKNQQREGHLQCSFGFGYSSTAVPCQIFGFFLFVIPTEVVVYAAMPVWYPLQYAFHKIRNDEREGEKEEKEKPEMKSEVVVFDYDSNERNLKVYGDSYEKGEELLSVKPTFRDNAIELKLKDIFDIEKNKNTAFRKKYIISFDAMGERQPIRLSFVLEQSETSNLEIE